MIVYFLIKKNDDIPTLNIPQRDTHIYDFTPSQVGFDLGYESPQVILNNNKESELIGSGIFDNIFIYDRDSYNHIPTLNIPQQDTHIYDFSPSQIGFDSGYESPQIIMNNNSRSETSGSGTLNNNSIYDRESFDNNN